MPIPRNFHPLVIALVVIVTSQFVILPASATEPTVVKLHGRHSADPVQYGAGLAVAVSERYVLVGERNNDDLFTDGGAVHVYSAITGRYLRKLTPTDGDAGDLFGWSVAVAGDTAIVGAPDGGLNETGKVYLFDLRNGRQKLSIIPEDAALGDRFGWSLSADGDRVLVGAPWNDEGNTDSGAAYLFHLVTGELLEKFYQETGSLGIELGTSVALCGHLALAGAPKVSEDAVQDGGAFLYDTQSGSLIGEFNSPTGSDDLAFGTSVSMSAGYALIGAPGDDEGGVNAGAAWHFSLIDGSYEKILAPDPGDNDEFGSAVSLSGALALVGSGSVDNTGVNDGLAVIYQTGPIGITVVTALAVADGDDNDNFGSAVALSGQRAVVGASGDDDLALDAGAAYFYREIVGAIPGNSLTQKGSFAPGAPEAEFRGFVQPVVTDDTFAFSAVLSGPGSNRNRDSGLWMNPSGPLELGMKSRQPLDAFGMDFTGLTSGRITVKGAGSLYGGEVVYEAALSGAGVSTRNRLALFAALSDSPVANQMLLRTGRPIPELGDAEVSTMLDARSDVIAAVPYLLRRGTGDATSLTDSGVLGIDVGTNTLVKVGLREGNSNASGEWRQFLGRVSTAEGEFVTGASFVPTGESKPVIGLAASEDQSPFVSVGDAEYGGSGATFRSFLGEGVWDSNERIFRASLKGTGVGSGNNEGLYFFHKLGTPSQMLREGQEIDPVNLPGVVISRILKWWSTNYLYSLVKLRGPGVNTSNDCALIVCTDGGPPFESFEVLLREGDGVGECDGARLRVIQRVEIDSEGNYAVVASLTGPSAMNQALFLGETERAYDSGNHVLAKPFLWMRKGTLYQSDAGNTTKLRSLRMAPLNDRFGVGGQGKPKVMGRGGYVALVLTFTDRAQDLVITSFFQRTRVATQ